MSDSTGLTVDLAQPEWVDAPESLATLLASHESGPITLQGGGCRALSTPLAQVILSARRTMHPRGIEVTIAEPSDELRSGLRVIGLESALLDGEAVA